MTGVCDHKLPATVRLEGTSAGCAPSLYIGGMAGGAVGTIRGCVCSPLCPMLPGRLVSYADEVAIAREARGRGRCMNMSGRDSSSSREDSQCRRQR